MQVMEISDRRVVVELYPEDCAMLARVCKAAFAHGFNDWSVERMTEPYIAFFEAAALAAGMHSHVTPVALCDELTLSAMRDGKVI